MEWRYSECNFAGIPGEETQYFSTTTKGEKNIICDFCTYISTIKNFMGLLPLFYAQKYLARSMGFL